MAGRWAIVIGVAAVGVMTLGAQTATSGGPVDTVPPDLQLSGSKTQNPLSDRKREIGAPVRVRVSCGDEECTARAKGRLTNVKKDKLKPWGRRSADVAPGRKVSLWLRLTKSQQREALKARDKGEKVKAKVTVRATDAAGNVATAKRTIRLK